MSDGTPYDRFKAVNENTVPFLTARVEMLEYVVAILLAEHKVDGVPMGEFTVRQLEEVAEKAAGKDALKCFAVEDFVKIVRAFMQDVTDDPPAS